MLLNVSVLLALQNPRFVMAVDRQDAVRAELFETASSDQGQLIENLLGDSATAETRQAVISGGRIRVTGRATSGARGVFVLAAVPGSGADEGRICRISRRPEGTNDNTEGAIRWCLSFLDERHALKVTLPPRTPAEQ